MKNTIIIGSDHAGFSQKNAVIEHLTKNGYQVQDCGPFSTDSVDYPDYAHQVATKVLSNSQYLGILLCGSGNGVCLTANKHQGIRAALCWLPELGSLARQHNNANVLCLPARYINDVLACDIVDHFLIAEFENGRHLNRVNKIYL